MEGQGVKGQKEVTKGKTSVRDTATVQGASVESLSFFLEKTLQNVAQNTSVPSWMVVAHILNLSTGAEVSRTLSSKPV